VDDGHPSVFVDIELQQRFGKVQFELVVHRVE
jgi:hypothetical protein